MNQRQMLLAGALLLTIIATAFAPPLKENEVIEARSVHSANAKVNSNHEEIRALATKNNFKLIEKRIWVTEKNRNLFAVKSKPLQPIRVLSQPLQLPQSKPTAPPLPFIYIGKVIEGGELTVFLAKQQQIFLLNGGEVINGAYRVDKVEASKVVFTYLPLEEEQVMVFGGRD